MLKTLIFDCLLACTDGAGPDADARVQFFDDHEHNGEFAALHGEDGVKVLHVPRYPTVN